MVKFTTKTKSIAIYKKMYTLLQENMLLFVKKSFGGGEGPPAHPPWIPWIRQCQSLHLYQF